MRFFPLTVFLILLSAQLNVFASGRSPSPTPTPGGDDRTQGISVEKFARAFGFRKVKMEKDHMVLKGDVHELLLYFGSRRSMVNGTLVWMNEPTVKQGKEWVITKRDVEGTFTPILRPSSALAKEGFQVVVLDPGHGGEDSGALSPLGITEKAIVLEVSMRVRALLQKQGVRVFLTRHDDRFLELEERPRRAGRWDADLFVSIHANSGGPSAQGAETFVLSLPDSLSTNQNPQSSASAVTHPGNQHNQANMALAYSLHHSLRMLPETVDRGVKRARFSVLRTADCPSALVEMGFLTHPVEGKRFLDPAHRERVARSIARGIDNYLRAVKTAVMTTESTTKEN